MFFSVNKKLALIIENLHKISQGNLEERIALPSEGKIRELAAAINNLVDNLKDRIEKIEKQSSEMGAILNNMVEGVIAIDKDTKIISINPAIERIFDVTKNQAEDRLFLEVFRNNDILEIINEVIKNGKFLSKELNLVWPVQKIFQINASPLFEKDMVSGCLVVIHDITEMKKLETVRSDFVANVSHELKTPLTSIKGFVETLLEGALDDKENNRGFLKIIQDHTERLNSLVNDLLSLSHLESSQTTVEETSFDLRQQVEEVISGFKSQLNKKGIEIMNELAQGISITADKDRIEQVFTNLIDNAIKFNKEKGYVKIHSQEINGKIKITIEDSGIGIPARDIPRIFERFYRVDKARSRNLGGTGLGLSIVKHIVELHGGSVGVESSEGFGSKFWFTLPK